MTSQPMMNTDEQVRSDCYKICAEFFGDIWPYSDENNIKVTRLPGGYINRLYLIEVDQNSDELSELIPRKFIIHLYGNEHYNFKTKMQSVINEIEEMMIVEKLSNIGIAPKIVGVFSGGRLEEFIESKLLDESDSNDPDLFKSFTRQLVKYHLQVMPISRSKKFSAFLTAPSALTKDISVYDRVTLETINKIFSFDFNGEIQWISSFIEERNLPLVFSHNDLRSTNILVLRDTNAAEKVMFVDNEMALYNYRGCDIGYFLTCLMLSFEQHDLLSLGINKTNVDETKKVLIKYYLSELERRKNKLNPSVDTEEHLTMEADIFILFTLISYSSEFRRIINNDHRNVFTAKNFDQKIIDLYQEKKNEFLKKYSNV